jgi:hypothetical protein
MIEESLLKSNFIGKDGFVWWIGQVAPASVWRNEKSKPDAGENKKGAGSPSWAYRCKVRIIGYHTFDGGVLPDDELPWAHVSVGAETGSAQGSVGQTMRLTGGETVFGFFIDGDDAQQPVVVGCLHRNESVQNLVDESFLQQEKSSQFRPFTGLQGKLSQGATQIRRQNDAVQGEPKTNSTPVDISDKSLVGDPVEFTREENKSGEDQLIRNDLATQQWETEYCSVKVVRENGCTDNLISKIQSVIEEFLNFVNGLISTGLSYLDTGLAYIDQILNTFVDLPTRICEFAGRILGIIKFIINNMRNGILGLIGKLFGQLIGLIVPLPQQPPIASATKNIMDIIFCVFEKILAALGPWLCDFLEGMVGNITNAPLCAVQQAVAAILAKIMDLLDDLLSPILSGVSWLVGGLGTVSSILSSVSSIAQQILNFLGCDQLKCETTTEWTPCKGSKTAPGDRWNKVLGNLNDIDINSNLGELSVFGYSGSSAFSDCTNTAKNPKDQDDQISNPPSTKTPYCIPPKVEIFGNGVQAQATAIVADDGSILSIKVVKGGKGYTKPPSINIIDNTNHGKGAKAKAKIKNGRVSAIYLTNSGSGYCKGDYTKFNENPTYLVTANKYSFFEGETVRYTVTTTNVPNGTKLEYDLSGDIKLEDMENVSSLSGNLIINSNTASISFKFKQDSINENVETQYFSLYDAEGNKVARTTVLVNNELSPILSPEPNNPNESPPGTYILPESGGTAGTGATTIITPPGIGGIGTSGDGIGIPPGGIGGIGTGIVGIITSIIPERPGYGYTDGDKIRVGNCEFGLILSKQGSIVGVTSISCSTIFDTLPTLSIITNTGQGAELYPVIEYTPPSTLVTTINEFGVINVVDCV